MQGCRTNRWVGLTARETNVKVRELQAISTGMLYSKRRMMKVVGGALLLSARGYSLVVARTHDIKRGRVGRIRAH